MFLIVPQGQFEPEFPEEFRNFSDRRKSEWNILVEYLTSRQILM